MSVFLRRPRCCEDCSHWADEKCDIGVPVLEIDHPATFVCGRHEIRPPELVPHPRFPDFWYRGWYDDPGMTSEAARTASRIEWRERDVVFDLGAHIGAFGTTALRSESTITAIFCEADPLNWPVLRRNVEAYGTRAALVEAACVGDVGDGTVRLWRTGYSGCGSVLWRRRTYSTVVPAVGWVDVLDHFRPTVIKVDVEGAEHGYDWTLVNPEVRLIHLESHKPDAGQGTVADGERVICKALEDVDFIVTHRKERHAFTVLILERVVDQPLSI